MCAKLATGRYPRIFRIIQCTGPVLFVRDKEEECAVLDAPEFFSRNLLLISTWLNFFGCGMLIAGMLLDPGAELGLLHNGTKPEATDCTSVAASFDGLGGLLNKVVTVSSTP